MPFALLIIGITLLAASVRDKQNDLYDLVRGDFTGPNNFIFWVVSILAIGAIGYIPKLKPLSTAFLALVVIVLFLSKGNPKLSGGGFFAQISQQLGTTTKPQVETSPGQVGAPLQTAQGPTIDLSMPENLFTIH
jgi:hypothetical protein